MAHRWDLYYRPGHGCTCELLKSSSVVSFRRLITDIRILRFQQQSRLISSPFSKLILGLIFLRSQLVSLSRVRPFGGLESNFLRVDIFYQTRVDLIHLH